MIKEDHVSFEVAQLLKEKGFDWRCNSHYWSQDLDTLHYSDYPQNWNCASDDWYSRPTLQMAMKWLREVHNTFIDIYLPSHSEHEDTIYHGTYSFDIFNLNTKVYVYCTWGEIEFNSYEQAVEAALKYSLKNLI